MVILGLDPGIQGVFNVNTKDTYFYCQQLCPSICPLFPASLTWLMQ